MKYVDLIGNIKNRWDEDLLKRKKYKRLCDVCSGHQYRPSYLRSA